MQTSENIFDDLHLVRFCSKKEPPGNTPSAASFQIRRNREDDLSFVCLQWVCDDAWVLVDNRPKGIVVIEKPYPLETTNSDLWAVSLVSTILSSIRFAARKAAQRANVEYSDISPSASHDRKSNIPAKVGVKWDGRAIAVSESVLDLAIANRLAITVEHIYPAKDNDKRKEKMNRRRRNRSVTL